MVYRMVTSIILWVAATVMALVGKLRDHDLRSVLGAATISTIAVWWTQHPDTQRRA